jgi:hypothetical protein
VKPASTTHAGDRRPAPSYSAPSIVELGTLHELTLGSNKDLGGADGITFQNQPITWTSP